MALRESFQVSVLRTKAAAAQQGQLEERRTNYEMASRLAEKDIVVEIVVGDKTWEKSISTEEHLLMSQDIGRIILLILNSEVDDRRGAGVDAQGNGLRWDGAPLKQAL
jgi:hypothetical protein